MPQETGHLKLPVRRYRSMKKSIGALIFLAGTAVAQPNNRYLDYAEGAYSAIPFKYPAFLAVEDVREVIRRLQEMTEDEISYIQHLPLPGIPSSASEIQIMLCEQGARLADTCDSGDMYIFRNVDDQWIYPGAGIGAWVE